MNSDSCLKPFKCLTIGHARVGALFIEGFNYINQCPPNDLLLHYQPDRICLNSIELVLINIVMVHLH